MSPPIRVALLGYGYAGKTFHAPLIQATPALQLLTVGSSQAEQVNRNLGALVHVTPHYADVVHDAEIDLVVIATPNQDHYALAMAALQAGKHVVVDKPFTLTYEEATQLTVYARQQNVLLSVFHNRRFDDDFLSLQQLLKTDAFSQPTALVSRFDRFRPHVRERWREQAVPGAGLWFDLGPHLLDQALQLFGEPTRISGAILITRPGACVDDAFAVHLHYPTCEVALHASMQQETPTPRFTLTAANAQWQTFGFDPQEAQLKSGISPLDPHFGKRSTDTDPVLPQGDYLRYYREIAQAINGKADTPVSASSATRVMFWLEQASNTLRQ